jgi:DNA excision repair protein ERCC-3
MDRHRMLFDERKWGLIVYDEVQHLPAAVARRSADLQAVHRLGLSASPVREDDKEEEIFTLIGPPIGTDWSALFDAGYVMEPEVEIRYVPWEEAAREEYASATGHGKRQLAATNPAKADAVRRLLAEHHDLKALVFVEYLDQGDALADALDAPFLSGETRHAERERLLADFREGRLDTLVVSRVGDEGIDLPEAGLAIVASGLGGSRRQGTQRAGRTMRPAGNALLYVLATRGTTEEEFARQQLRHLAGKGVRITESTVDPT